MSKTTRVFRPDQCHQRDDDGNPTCNKKRAKPHWNLCAPHQALWRAAARQRAKDRAAEAKIVAQAAEAQQDGAEAAAQAASEVALVGA